METIGDGDVHGKGDTELDGTGLGVPSDTGVTVGAVIDGLTEAVGRGEPITAFVGEGLGGKEEETIGDEEAVEEEDGVGGNTDNDMLVESVGMAEGEAGDPLGATFSSSSITPESMAFSARASTRTTTSPSVGTVMIREIPKGLFAPTRPKTLRSASTKSSPMYTR